MVSFLFFFLLFFRVSQYLSKPRDREFLCLILWGSVHVYVREMRRRDWKGEAGGLQLEVSEWTLPGPSVGDVTDEGVGASCQPPFVCEDETARRVRMTRTVAR